MSTSYYLRLQAAKGVGAAAQRAILKYVFENSITLADLFSSNSSDWKDVGLTDSQIEGLRNSERAVEKWQLELEAQNVQVIGCLDPIYPKRLSHVLNGMAPPILYTWGNLGLLNNPSVGFCGSRSASEQGMDVAKDTAQQIAERGWTVVSGHAKGIDIIAHHTALQHKGTTVVVAPEGILGFRLRSELREVVDQENILVISEFRPDSHWSVANAMTRNHTICGLSDALVVVQAGLTGGTFEAGKFALQVKVPLFVADYANPQESAPGNPYFIERGAKPVRRSQETGRANLQRIFLEVESHYTNLANPQPAQASLFALDGV